MLKKIVSGGQTGADRAALDFAIRHGVAHGGWCPRGRRAEDGVIPADYCLTETPSDDYAVRTRWNVRDSDGTLVVTRDGRATGGTALTLQHAAALGRPCLHLHAGAPQATLAVEALADQLQAFLSDHQITTLNVAGPRASQQPRVGVFVEKLLTTWLVRQSEQP